MVYSKIMLVYNFTTPVLEIKKGTVHLPTGSELLLKIVGASEMVHKSIFPPVITVLSHSVTDIQSGSDNLFNCCVTPRELVDSIL